MKGWFQWMRSLTTDTKSKAEFCIQYQQPELRGRLGLGGSGGLEDAWGSGGSSSTATVWPGTTADLDLIHATKK